MQCHIASLEYFQGSILLKALTLGPQHQSFVHLSGAIMKEGKMVVVDNSGLLDPRIRRFLALEGIIYQSSIADKKRI